MDFMPLITLGVLEFIVSFVAPYIWLRNPRISVFIAATNVGLMVVLAWALQVGMC